MSSRYIWDFQESICDFCDVSLIKTAFCPVHMCHFKPLHRARAITSIVIKSKSRTLPENIIMTQNEIYSSQELNASRFFVCIILFQTESVKPKLFYCFSWKLPEKNLWEFFLAKHSKTFCRSNRYSGPAILIPGSKIIFKTILAPEFVKIYI